MAGRLLSSYTIVTYYDIDHDQFTPHTSPLSYIGKRFVNISRLIGSNVKTIHRISWPTLLKPSKRISHISACPHYQMVEGHHGTQNIPAIHHVQEEGRGYLGENERR